MTVQTEERPRRSRWRTAVLIAIVLVLVMSAIGTITPWPSAMVIRGVFTLGAQATVTEMLRHQPDAALTEMLDLPFTDDDADAGQRDAMMDVFSPAEGSEPLPTVVWIHGGAWISGSKDDVAPYLRILAAEGYTTIGVNYPRGPEAAYPSAVHQLNQALAYIDEHAEALRVDPERIVLAGDSAGAQLASQLAALTTNPAYAELLGVTPALRQTQLAGTILHCGVYDLAALAALDGLVGWGLKTSMWAYSGTRTWAEGSVGATMSTVEWVTEDFPPTFISGGNGDALTWLQSIPMSKRLTALDVEVDELFWPAPHEPALGHEYQFHLDLDEAQVALEETLQFLQGLQG